MCVVREHYKLYNKNTTEGLNGTDQRTTKAVVQLYQTHINSFNSKHVFKIKYLEKLKEQNRITQHKERL